MTIRLTACPYCQECEICLDEHPQLVFTRGAQTVAPCRHLAWVDGRYSQWERGEHGASRMIGSSEFRWHLGGPQAEEWVNSLLPYLHELVEIGSAWPHAPEGSFTIQRLTAEEKTTGADHREQTSADVDGTAIFAADPESFWRSVPQCQDRWLETFNFQGDQ